MSIELINILGEPYYHLIHEKVLYLHFKNIYILVDVYTAKEFLIDEKVAVKIAKLSYNGLGEVTKIIMLESSISDFPKQQNPTWQIDFDDVIEASSGIIVGHSDEHKRLADILFMLHFMDYANNCSFNNTQNVFFAIAALWLALSGFVWTVHLGLKGKYTIIS